MLVNGFGLEVKIRKKILTLATSGLLGNKGSDGGELNELMHQKEE